MPMRHHAVWPDGRPFSLGSLPATLFDVLARSAARMPDKPALVFFDSLLRYDALLAEVETLAGWLQQAGGVQPGDRVLLQLQSVPQFVIGYYAILRAGAVVVPVNPMNRMSEIAHMRDDCGARLIITAQDTIPQILPLLGDGGLAQALIVTYSDYLHTPTTLAVPEGMAAPAVPLPSPALVAWRDALAAGHRPAPFAGRADDLAVLPYTSGSTGLPKGCRHSNATTLHSLYSVADWFGVRTDDVVLSVAPLFHVTGMQAGMNTAMERGCTLVMLPRWDRDAVAELIQRYRISVWPAIPTMAVDLLTHPELDRFDLSSIRLMFGGGVAMPEAIADRLQELCGITFLEGYGMTETMAPTTANPPQRPLRQCGGIPVFDTEVRIVDLDSLAEVPVGTVGEILIAGPQVLLGYWNNPEADAASFRMIDGKRFLRSGDLGRMDEQGYIFLVDRLKRMINVAGYKVWPAEVESMMYAHPAIQEVCIVGVEDARSGEAVKALIVLKPSAISHITTDDMIAWCRQTMAAYKVPRQIEFVETLLRSGTGKVQWLAMQQRERQRQTAAQVAAQVPA